MIGTILQKLYPITVNMKVCCSDLPFSLKYSSPMLLETAEYWHLRAEDHSAEESCMGQGQGSIIRGVPTSNNWIVLGSKGLAPFSQQPSQVCRVSSGVCEYITAQWPLSTQ